MTNEGAPFGAVLVMRVGFHAGESLDEILQRKTAEIAEHGFTYWGYGGSSCHPLTQVQPFHRDHAPVVAFVLTVSDPGLTTHEMSEVSADKSLWRPVSPHRVTSSKWGLVLTSLKPVATTIDLSLFEVAIGQSKGKPLSAYLRGRCDKACAVSVAPGVTSEHQVARIEPVVALGRLGQPAAVFFR